jgi:hypothetical protein
LGLIETCPKNQSGQTALAGFEERVPQELVHMRHAGIVRHAGIIA